jgi:hypothetical protein
MLRVLYTPYIQLDVARGLLIHPCYYDFIMSLSHSGERVLNHGLECAIDV